LRVPIFLAKQKSTLQDQKTSVLQNIAVLLDFLSSCAPITSASLVPLAALLLEIVVCTSSSLARIAARPHRRLRRPTSTSLASSHVPIICLARPSSLLSSPLVPVVFLASFPCRFPRRTYSSFASQPVLIVTHRPSTRHNPRRPATMFDSPPVVVVCLSTRFYRLLRLLTASSSPHVLVVALHRRLLRRKTASSASPPVHVVCLATDVPSMPGILEADVAQSEEEVQAEPSRDVRTCARKCIHELDALLLREVLQSFIKYFVDGCLRPGETLFEIFYTCRHRKT
jgi:hypothetical protein